MMKSSKRTILTIVATGLVSLMFTGCVFSEGAKQLMTENTQRVQTTSNDRKEVYLKALDIYSKMDKREVIVDPKTGKVEVRKVPTFPEFFAQFKMGIYNPEKVKSMLAEAGDFLSKGGSTLVSGYGLYLGNKTQMHSLDVGLETTKSNNQLQQGMLDTYTGTYNNNSVQVVEPSVHTITNTDTQIVEPTVVDPVIVNPEVIENDPVIVNPIIVDNTPTDSQ